MTQKNLSDYLSITEIRTFIFANVLHAIDNDLIKLDIYKIKLDIEQKKPEEGSEVKKSCSVHIKIEDKEIFNKDFSLLHESYEEALRNMMGLTMMVLDTLKKNEEKSKPVLRIVK